MEEVERHLEQSGYYHKLGDILREKLQDCGWYDNVFAFAGKELGVADSAQYGSSEVEAIRSRALQMVPEDVKVQMLQLILQIVDEHVEEA